MILTIGRQLGAGGLEVGKKVAEATGMKFFDREILDEAARQSGLSTECFQRADEKSKHSLGVGIFGMRFPFINEASNVNGNALSNDKLFQMQSETIEMLAEKYKDEGTIFVGRCANYVLREHEDMRSVFLTASTEDRVRRIVERRQCTEEEAHAMIKKIEGQRKAYFDYYASRTWGKASSYHMCLNTSVLGMETCVDMILQILGKK